jgi:choice-of-anchor B domain-containing protein
MIRIIIFIFLLSGSSGFAQQSWNLPLLGTWHDPSIPAAWTGPYNTCRGYYAAGREYAFLASTQGTYFFEITEPSNPRLIDFIRTRDTVTLVVNKDYAIHQHYLYAVSDQGDNSLQIFDLKYLPDSVVKVYDSNVLSKRCHTIFSENGRLYMCSNTRPNNTFGPMDVMSLADPENPVLMATISHPGFSHTHEVFVKNDTAYMSNGNAGLWIYNLATPSSPELLEIFDFYPEQGYNHSSWLTANSKTIVFTDENHGLGVKIMDITDLNDPQLYSIVRSNLLNITDSLSSSGSVAHIPYIVNNYLLLSYYHDGVQIFDITNPANPKKVAWYDTHPQSTNYSSYQGCWGLFPFLPSGNIIASDINNGLFILDGSHLLKNNQPPGNPTIQLSPNLVNDELEVFYIAGNDRNLHAEIYDMTGKLIYRKDLALGESSGIIRIPVYGLSSGLYFARLTSGNASFRGRFFKGFVK